MGWRLSSSRSSRNSRSPEPPVYSYINVFVLFYKIYFIKLQRAAASGVSPPWRETQSFSSYTAALRGFQRPAPITLDLMLLD